jgi:hypothetical protein
MIDRSSYATCFFFVTAAGIHFRAFDEADASFGLSVSPFLSLLCRCDPAPFVMVNLPQGKVADGSYDQSVNVDPSASEFERKMWQTLFSKFIRTVHVSDSAARRLSVGALKPATDGRFKTSQVFDPHN